jgi:phage FluMu protein Com
MSKTLKLQDAYRFHGFRPAATLYGVFGDQKARVVTLRRRGKKMVCGGCGAVNHAIYDRKTIRARDLPCADMRVYVEFEIRRVKCPKCGKVKQEKLDWLSDNPAYTKRFVFFYRPQMPGDAAERCGPGDAAGLEDGKRAG